MTIFPTQPIDTGRLISALVLATTALYLLCGRLRAPYNRLARNAALAIYGIALAGALIYAGLWLLGVGF
jgi:hypothetical protein